MGPWWWWPLLRCLYAVLVHGTVLAGGQRLQERPPRLAGWSPTSLSSWVPTPESGASGDPEGSAAALAFLQTGDAQRLAQANCSRGVAAGAPGPGPPPALRVALRAAPEALAHAANFLNMLFQTNDIREASVAEDVEWYQALVRSLAEGHPWVRRAVLALDAHPLAAKPRLMLQATKGDGEILLQDVSAAAPSLGNLSWDNEWFNAFKSQRTPLLLRKRVLSNDLRSMETPKWQQGDSYVGEPGHVRWSPPFLECRDGKFLPAWTVTLSSAFYGLKPDLSPEFKGVVRVDVELRDVAIDQCASGPGWFADTHRCDLNSTQCVPQESRGFVLGRYLCRCKPGFYGAGGVASGARAGVAGSTAGADGGSRLACRPCRQGCATCKDDAPCLIQEDRALRAAILSCQACCMLAVFLSMLVSYHFRRSKRIRASGVILLETILFGSLLLYFPVFILYFKPSIFRCIVLRWVRLLGFAIVYGTITLKLYRVLKVFLSRTAQRAPYVSSGQVLKMLGLILLLVLWFLAAWTIGMLENVEKNIPLVIRTQTARGLHFYICSHDHWDYMMVIAEMLFLLWGSFLCYATRAVPSAFHEPRYMGIALHNELMISAAFHVVRFIMVPSLHPDWTLLLFFAHTHGTITMTLALLFIPKFLHAGSPLREEIAAEVYEDELDLRRSGSCLNSSIASAWSEHSLDPDDIREELKKLYMQLEVHKTRRMAANNPHLPKKRSSRRSLARSIARRGAEPPEAAARRGSSAKRLPNAGGTSLRLWEDGSRRHAAAPRKSLSAEGPPRGGSLTPSPPGRKAMVTPASEQSDSESLDDAPLVCKSASAHNLVGHGQPPPPRAAPLQKSLSVVAGAREEALLAASQAAREVWRANRHLSAPSSQHPTGQGHPKEAGKPRSPAAADSLRPAGSSPAEGWPQEDTSPPGDGKVQKHVTYAPVKSISIDSSHLPGRVRVAVRRTPPRPPVRYQSLGQRAVPAGDSPEPAEPPADPLERAGEPEGTPAGMVEEDAGQTSPAAGKGRLLPAASLPAQVCPWELVQEEILSRKQKAAEAADSGTLGDTAATPPSIKPPSQKTSFRSLGLAIKAFNRSRGKSILRGKREGEGSLRKRGHEREGGSRRERLSRAETAAASPEGIGRDPTAKSPEWSRQRPGSEPTARPWQGDAVPCQQNNNAGTAWEATGWGDGRGETEGQRDSPALGTGDGEKPAEEPSAPQGDADDGRAQEPPSGVHEVPPSVGPQGAEHPPGSPEAASSGKAWIRPQEGAEAPMAEAGKDAPAATVRLLTPKEGAAGLAEGLEGASRSLCPQDRAEVEQPHAKAVASSNPPSTTGVRRVAAEKAGAEVRPRGAPGTPGGRGALLHQEAIASQEDPVVPLGEESPAKALEKRGSQPEPLGPGGSRGTERVPPRSQSMEVAPAAVGKATRAAGRQAEVCPGETQADSSIKIKICPWEESGGPGRALGKGSSEGDPGRPREKPGVEEPLGKTPGLLKAASEKAGSVEGRRAEVCPWEAAGADSDAEVCPWERGTALSHAGKLDDGKISQVKKGISPQRAGETAPAADKGSSQQGSPHPRGGAAKHPALPKTPSKQAGTTDSKKADICPWEVEDEPIAKTEICPWEEPAAPSGKEKPSQDTPGTSKGENKPGSGGFEDIKAKLAEMGGHQPGRRDTEISAKLIRKSLESSRAESKKSQSVDSIKEEICPWESLGKEQPPEQPRARSPALPPSPSKKSQSVESLKAEVCPWESQKLESSEKAEICPWEAAAPPLSKEKSRQDRDALPTVSKRPSRGQGLSKEVGDGTSGKKEEASRDRESVCPWESADTEGSSTGYSTKSTELLKATAEKSGSTGSTKAEVCPWESLSSEQPPKKPSARSPALPPSPSKQSQSVESLKAEVCPWESQEFEAPEKAEICPWEAAAPPLSKEKSRQDRDALPTVSKRPSRGQGLSKEVGDGTSGKKEEASRDRESVCPWESLGAEQPPEQPRARSPALPPSPSKQSQSVESLKAEVCPWEALEVEAPEKAEICPWEVAAAPSDQPKAKQGPGGGSKGDKRIRRQAALASPVRSLEKGSSEREAVCPWESLSSEQPPEKPHAESPALPQTPSKKSQSVESLKAEVCPWESQEVEATDKAEICPWEAAAPPLSKEKSRQDRDALPTVSKRPSRGQGLSKEIGLGTSGKKEEASRDRESVCPWESADTEGSSTGYSTKSTELLKATAGKSGSTGSTKAEVCPWESLSSEQPPKKPSARSPALPQTPSKQSQSGESLKAEVCPWELEPMEKAEICPWEAAAPPSSKEKSRQDRDALPTVSKRPSRGQGLSKEIGLGTSGKKEEASRDRESVCLWESADTEGSSTGYSTKSTELLKATAGKSGSTGSTKAEVCPWESLSSEQPPEKPHAESPALPQTPSKQSQSGESLKAEVCPWESQEVEATDKAEICPWEAAAPPSSKEKSRQDRDALPTVSKRPSRGQGLSKEIGLGTSGKKEEASRDRESVCPWESADTEGSSTGYSTKSTELLKATAGKSGSTGSAKAEVCPWESLSSEQPPEKPHAESPALPQTPSKQSQSGESLKAEVCPWESQELESSEKAEICPWEAAAPPSSKEKSRQDRDALPTVSKRPSRGQGLSKEVGDGTSGKKEEASRDRESVCPWESADTEGSSTGYSTKSTELLKATAGKSGSTGSAKAEVCPWESLSSEQPPKKPSARSPALPQSPSKQSQSVESLKAEVCPWEAPEIEAPEKAEICPWEAAAPLQEKGAAPGKVSLPPKKAGASKLPEKGSSEREAICPWESLGTEELSLKTAPGKEPSKKSDSSESRKTAICPWEAAEPTGSEKESFEPSVPPQGAGRASPMGTEKSQAVAGARAVAPTALLKKSKGRSDGEAEHKPLCRILPGIQPGPTAELPPRRASTAPAAGSSPSPSASVAEVCPWETEEAPSASDKTSTDTRKTSEVCPWEVESVDPTPTLRGQGRAGVSPQDGGRGVSETKPDVCPWDHE